MANNGSQHIEGPLFYKRPVPLQAERHANYRIDTSLGVGFAARANAVPITVAEFSHVARHYPIVFAGGENPAPAAVMGLRQEENLFVDGEGRWALGCYVPAYIRRYPFIFSEDTENNRFTLCIDEGADAVIEGDGEGEPLFVGGQPSAFTNKALEFTTAFQREAAMTREFVAELLKHELLTAATAQFHRSDLGDVSLGGFKVIDEKKFNALDDEIFIGWRPRGVLPLFYAQLISMGNWEQLAARVPVQDDAAER